MKRRKFIFNVLIWILFTACFLTCSTEIEDNGYIKFKPPKPNPNAPEGQLIVVGNKVFNQHTGVEVRLLGANIWEYDIMGNDRFRYARSMEWAYNKWHANIIRIPLEVEATEIYSGGQKRPQGDYPGYINRIKYLISKAEKHKKYVILDLHTYVMLTEKDMSFWRYWASDPDIANNPFVLFGLQNEPHDVSWDTWRNGGFETPTGEYRYGYQQCLEMIRDLGAKNVVLAGGLDWGYDLRGIVGEAPGDHKIYALVDQGSNGNKSKAGFGIIYDCHIYPWKGMGEWANGGKEPGKTLEFAFNDWVEKSGGARKLYPVLSGEVGWQFADTSNIVGGMFLFRDQNFRNSFMETEFSPDRYYVDGKFAIEAEFAPDGFEGDFMPAGASNHKYWMSKILEYFDDDKTYGSTMHYTAWCWHFGVSPIILRPTGQPGANDRNNYARWDPVVSARMSSLNGTNRCPDHPECIGELNEEEMNFLYKPNHFSGQYFYDHMRQVARDRGEFVD